MVLQGSCSPITHLSSYIDFSQGCTVTWKYKPNKPFSFQVSFLRVFLSEQQNETKTVPILKIFANIVLPIDVDADQNYSHSFL